MFTATRRPSPAAIDLRHSCTRQQASISTQRPSAMIWPVSSAIGMNWPGSSRPCSGCCQRTSASTPSSSVVFRSMIGWNSRKNSLAGQRLVQVVLEPQALAQLLLHARVEHDVPALAGGLGVVHRDVGVAQHVLGVVARLRERDADAGGHQQVVAVDRERLPECVGDGRGDAARPARAS